MYLNFSILQLWRAYQSRWDQVWICFRKLLLRSTNWYINHADSMHLSGNIACQNWQIIAKFCTVQPLYLLNQVTKILAVPARILRIFFSTKPSPLRGFGEKKCIFFVFVYFAHLRLQLNVGCSSIKKPTIYV
jgi:hypothetical protein